MSFFIKLGLCLFVIFNSFADSRVGNGGDGIKEGGRVYLFDLYESNVHQQAVLESMYPDQEILEKLRVHFASFSHFFNSHQSEVNYSYDQFIYEVAKKVTAIKQKDYLFGYAVERAIVALNWFVVDQNLIDIKDDDGTDLDINIPLVQLAVRSFQSIRIDQKLFAKMDIQNAVALVIHEVLYCLIRVEKGQKSVNYVARKLTHPDGTVEEIVKTKYVNYQFQSSRKVRELVAKMFLSKIENISSEDFVSLLGENFPSGQREVTYYTEKSPTLIYHKVWLGYGNKELISDFSEKSLLRKFYRSCKYASENDNGARRSSRRELLIDQGIEEHIFVSTAYKFEFDSYVNEKQTKNYYFLKKTDGSWVNYDHAASFRSRSAKGIRSTDKKIEFCVETLLNGFYQAFEI